MDKIRLIPDLAYLAKDKGYNIPCYYYYSKFNNDLLTRVTTPIQVVEYGCLAPTQEEICQWLRDNYNIFIRIDYEFTEERVLYSVMVLQYSKYKRQNFDSSELHEGFHSYYDALNHGIKIALETCFT